MSGIRVRSAAEEIERMRERARYNEAAALNRARRETRNAMAKSMKNEGFDTNTISRIAELSVDEILRL